MPRIWESCSPGHSWYSRGNTYSTVVYFLLNKNVNFFYWRIHHIYMHGVWIILICRNAEFIFKLWEDGYFVTFWLAVFRYTSNLLWRWSGLIFTSGFINMLLKKYTANGIVRLPLGKLGKTSGNKRYTFETSHQVLTSIHTTRLTLLLLIALCLL